MLRLAADTEAGPLDDLLGHSITYRIVVGPRAGQKLFTLQTVPPRPQGPEGEPNGAARAGGFRVEVADVDVKHVGLCGAIIAGGRPLTESQSGQRRTRRSVGCRHRRPMAAGFFGRSIRGDSGQLGRAQPRGNSRSRTQSRELLGESDSGTASARRCSRRSTRSWVR
jgi:hypothetical protein